MVMLSLSLHFLCGKCELVQPLALCLCGQLASSPLL